MKDGVKDLRKDTRCVMLIPILKGTTGTTSRVRLGVAMSDSFLTSSGVRQEILAPALFCRAIDFILE